MSGSLIAPRHRPSPSRLIQLVAVGGIILVVSSARAQDGLDLQSIVQTTLRRSVAIQESVESTKFRDAELQISQGAFDLVVGFSAEGGRTSRLFSGAEQAVNNVSLAYTGVSSYRIGADRLTRSGITISPAMHVIRHDAITLAEPSVVQTRAALELGYPILIAGKRSPESADVSSAYHALQASKFDEQHARASSVYRSAIAYWVYLGAFQALDILTESEEKAKRLLEETKSLVEGGERAAADLDQLRADLADRFAARIAAERRLLEARLTLGIVMGVAADQAAGLAPPSSEFPRAPDVAPTFRLTGLEAVASLRRADLAGTENMVRAAAEGKYARSLQARPRLDLLVSMGYAGLSENRLPLGHHLPPFGQNHVTGTQGSLSLVLRWPTSNHRARGRLERQTAVWRQAQIARDDLARRIRSGLKAASKQLESSIEELAKLEEAVELYTASVENEMKKLQLGMSTQFELILVEERLRNSLLARVSARVRYAEAIARLKFESGTLIINHLRPDEIANRLLSPAVEAE